MNGAKDIIAEDISDDAECRKKLRVIIFQNAILTSRAAKDEDSVYQMYMIILSLSGKYRPTGSLQ